MLVRVAVLAIAATLCGCRSSSRSQGTANTSTATTSTPTAAPTTTAAAPRVVPIPRGATAPPFALVKSPTAKDVPNRLVRGSLNGRRFEVVRMQIEAWIGKGWVLSFFGNARAPLRRLRWDAEYVELPMRAPFEHAAVAQQISEPPARAPNKRA